MNAGSRAMRRLSARLVGSLRVSADEDVVPALGRALGQVRGRPVRLRKAAFPPATASGLWVDRADHDLIVYEENTDPEHQLVIIGHEAWHMFRSEGAGRTGPEASAARAAGQPGAGVPTELAAVLPAVADGDGLSPDVRTDAALHVAARADAHAVDEEVEAERFGFRFATDMQTVLAEARGAVDPADLAGRIQASMAHRVRPL
ncbi:toxin-antitoxin system, toxin component [Streptomyces thermocoprophilus]|uniref:Toxin-antitoxin system, toxin component n=2 Tax=Streptomyces TaxID=1883 RepID=A0ABV5VLZ4_9ACTN